MTTPRDLLMVAMDRESGNPALDREPGRPVQRGNLSLALAGAELIDLLGAQAFSLAGDRIVPGYRPTLDDRLLEEAASALDRQAPFESVDDWLWRRGRGLFTAYLAALEAEGQVSWERPRGWMPLRVGRLVLTDSPDRRRAAYRWTSDEPVLTALVASVEVLEEPAAEDSPGVADGAVATVLAAVDDAVRSLEFERQRRAIDEAAFDNVWRGGDG
ncbi:GPP34 family phosphoprotein [Streptomyces sp. NPDC020742]|uniref:GOLPH3/VPS74 family protein n=1 Tax=Streptomyces sp. NPDC020742 TaxID=3154897 RepID=UPI0033D2B438